MGERLGAHHACWPDGPRWQREADWASSQSTHADGVDLRRSEVEGLGILWGAQRWDLPARRDL